MADYNTSIYQSLVNGIKSPEQFRSERQQLQASELTNALNRQKVDAYTRDQARQNNLLNMLGSGATADDLVKQGYFDEASKRQTFDANKVDESRKAEKWTQEKTKFVLGVQKDLAGRVLANPSGQAAMAAIAEMERISGQNMDGERQKVAMLQSPDDIRRWAASHALSAEQLLPKFETLNTGGTIQDRKRDPITGAVTVAGSTPMTMAPGQAAQLGLQREQFEESKRHNRATEGIAAAKATTPGAGGQDSTGKPVDLKEGQAKATAFLGQMRAAQKTLGEIGADGVGLGSQLGVAIAGGRANIAAGAKSQQIKQAQNQWSEAYLRFKTGAAATLPEVELNNATFFPQVGDKPEVVAQKKAARLQAERDLELVTGPGAAALTTPRNEATPAKQMSAQDKQALDWANANPKDPRAAQIKQRLGM